MAPTTKTAGLALAIALALPGAALADDIDALHDKEFNEQTGTCITIIFDDSGSMHGMKIRQAKQAFTSWLKAAPQDLKFSLITFQAKGRIQIPLGKDTRDRVAARVSTLKPRYETPICRSIALAAKQIQERRQKVTPYERHVVLVFTDGAENVDKRGNKGVQQDIAKLRATGVEVIGIGFYGEGSYLEGAATKYFAATNEEDLRSGLSRVDSEVGDNDEIEITPEDLKALKAMEVKPPPSPAELSKGTAKMDTDQAMLYVDDPKDGKAYALWYGVPAGIAAFAAYKIFGKPKAA